MDAIAARVDAPIDDRVSPGVAPRGMSGDLGTDCLVNGVVVRTTGAGRVRDLAPGGDWAPVVAVVRGEVEPR